MTDGQIDAPEWSYRLGDQVYGPLTLQQLQHAADAGLLPPTTSVHSATTGTSQPAGLLLAYRGIITDPKLGDDAAMRLLLPVGQSGWAIAAGYLGLVSLLLWPLGPIAMVAAEFGRQDITKNERKHGWLRVVVGYLCGALGTSFFIGILIVSLES